MVIEVVNPGGLGLGLVSNVDGDVISGYNLYNSDYNEIKGKAQWGVESVIGVIPERRGAVIDLDFEDSDGYLLQGYVAVFNNYGYLDVVSKISKSWFNSQEGGHTVHQVISMQRRPNSVEGAVSLMTKALRDVGDPQADLLHNAREVYENTLRELLF